MGDDIQDPGTIHIRQAVASGEYEQALDLWNQYGERIRAEILGGACTVARMIEAREFLEWARKNVLCARSQCGNRLGAIHVAQQYGSASIRPHSLLQASL